MSQLKHVLSGLGRKIVAPGLTNRHFNKSREGIETNVVGENNVEAIDAKKALVFSKLKTKNKEANK